MWANISFLISASNCVQSLHDRVGHLSIKDSSATEGFYDSNLQYGYDSDELDYSGGRRRTKKVGKSSSKSSRQVFSSKNDLRLFSIKSLFVLIFFVTTGMFANSFFLVIQQLFASARIPDTTRLWRQSGPQIWIHFQNTRRKICH